MKLIDVNYGAFFLYLEILFIPGGITKTPLIPLKAQCKQWKVWNIESNSI